MADTYVSFDQRELDLLFKGPDSATGKFLMKKLIQAERAAKRFTPVDTGRLRSSITREMGGDAEGMVGRVGTNVEYARRIEFGFVGTDSLGRTYNQAPRSFLRAAVLQIASGTTGIMAVSSEVSRT